MASEQLPPEGFFFLRLKCQSCGAPKQLTVPAHEIPLGSVLQTHAWGPDADCQRCGAALLEVMNTPPQVYIPPTRPRGLTKKT